MEAVVVRRARILDPPVAADEAVVRVVHAGVRRDAVHHRAEAEHAGRGRPVAFVPVRRNASSAEPRAPAGRPRASSSRRRAGARVDACARGRLSQARRPSRAASGVRGRAESRPEKRPRRRAAGRARPVRIAGRAGPATSAHGAASHACAGPREDLLDDVALRVGVVLRRTSSRAARAPASSARTGRGRAESRRRWSRKSSIRSTSGQPGEKTWRFTFGSVPLSTRCSNQSGSRIAEDVARGLERRHVRGLVGRVGHDEHDVDDRLCGEPGDGRRARVLDAQRRRPERVPDARLLAGEEARPSGSYSTRTTGSVGGREPSTREARSCSSGVGPLGTRQ